MFLLFCSFRPHVRVWLFATAVDDLFCFVFVWLQAWAEALFLWFVVCLFVLFCFELLMPVVVI